MEGLQIACFRLMKLRKDVPLNVIFAELAEASRGPMAADLVVLGLGLHAQAGQHGRGELAS